MFASVPAKRAPLLVLAAILLLGCPHDEESFRFKLITVPVGAACNSPGELSLPGGVYDIRITFMKRPSSTSVTAAVLGRYELVCDRIFPPQGPSEFQVPVSQGARVSVRVEAFKRDADHTLAYSGQSEDVDLGGSGVTVYLRPAASQEPSFGMSCARSSWRARAFHSATLLPNGQVLLFGGLAGTSTGMDKPNKLQMTGNRPPGVAHLTASAEYYDPSTYQALLTNDDPSCLPRAFHRAYLLPSPPQGPYQILVVGGVSAEPSSTDALWIKYDQSELPFLFSPTGNAKPAPPLRVTFTPGEKPAIRCDPLGGDGTAALFAEAGSFFVPTAPTALAVNGLVLTAGGATGFTPVFNKDGKAGGFRDAGAAEAFDVQAGKPGDVPRRGPESLSQVRVGHAVASLGSSSYLVLGGNMSGKDADTPVTEVAELVRVAEASITVTPFPFASTPPPTAWHTLTPIGGSDEDISGDERSLASAPPAVLWAGGFLLRFERADLRIARGYPSDKPSSSSPAPFPNDTGLRWISAADATGGGPAQVHDVEATTAEAFKPVGYHEALRIGRGRVLLLGGNADGADYDCPASGDQPCCKSYAICPQGQMAILEFDGTNQKVVRSVLPTPHLGTARLGHRATRLLDGTVLISGGITVTDKATNAPQVTFDAEIYNPRTADSSDDYPFRRLPGKDSKDSEATNKLKGTRCALRGENAP
jgi:hypothetical protein